MPKEILNKDGDSNNSQNQSINKKKKTKWFFKRFS